MKERPWVQVSRITENQYSKAFTVEYTDGKVKVFPFMDLPPAYINKQYEKSLFHSDPGIIIYTPVRS